jgi:hypothetical protein
MKMTDEELVKQAHTRFDQALEEARENRELFIEDLKFYAGEQWPDRVRRDREIQDRPVLTINRLPMFVRQVTNDQRINRPSIKVRPVDSGADMDTAEILSGIVRHIERNSNADIAYDTAFFYAVAGGFGFFRIVTDYCDDESFEQEILIKPIINSMTVYYDHEAQSLDGSKWRYAFITEEIPKKEFEKKYPGKLGGWNQSTGDTQSWVMADSVRIAEYWYVTEEDRTILQLEDGTVITQDEYDKLPAEAQTEPVDQRVTKMRVVKWAKIGGNEVLERGDWAGKWIPIVPVFGDMIYLDGKISLFSLIRFAKDPQRMLNYYRSTETELLALQPKAPFIAAEGQVEGYEELWAKANRENYSTLIYKPTTVSGMAVPPPERQAFAPPPTGVLQGAENAQRDMMSTTGIYESSLGMRSNEQSGRAILARQREGDVSTFHFIDNMTRAVTHAGRILVDLIPKIYDTPRIVRILGEDGKEEMVSVNQPFVDKDEYGQAIERIYDLGTGRYDVVVEAGVSFSTKREEAANSMMEMVKTNPQIMGIAGDLIVKSMDWPGAEQLAERLEMMLPPNLQKPKEGQPQMPPEIQMQLQQSQQMIQQLDQTIQQMSAELEKKDIEQRKLQIDEFNAQTQRLKVQGELELKVEEMFKEQQQDTTEMDKAELDAQVKLVTLEKTIEANRELKAIELRADLLKERMARGMVEMDVEGNVAPGEVLRDLMQQVATLKRSVTATREIVRDEAGRAIGLRPLEDGEADDREGDDAEAKTPLTELDDVIRDLASLKSMLSAPKEIVRDETGRAVGVRLALMNQEQGENDGD